MKKQVIFLNAIMTSIQVGVSGIVLFILYWFLLKTIGVEQIGIWSVVLAVVSVANVASLGLEGSVVKFVAQYLAGNKYDFISLLTQTAVIFVTLSMGITLAFLYPIFKWIIGLIVAKDSLALGISILPIAILIPLLTAIRTILQAAINGCQRFDITRSVQMIEAILNLLLCFMLVPVYKLKGVAVAFLIPTFVTLVLSWILARKLVHLPFIPYRWDSRVFKEIIFYGVNFQVISIAVMAYEPVTKSLLSRFGGLAMVGYFSIAARMVQQLRLLVVSAVEVIVPVVADLKESSIKHIKSLYLNSYRLLFYIALPLHSLIIISAPLVSKLWIGSYNSTFVIFTTLIALGYFLDTLDRPAYHTFLGVGRLHWNVIGAIVVAILNVTLGLFFGIFFNGFGVVVAWIVSVILGSSVIIIFYHLENKVPLTDLLPMASRRLALVCLIATLFFLGILYKLSYVFNLIVFDIAIVLLFLGAVSIPLWHHSMRDKLISLIFSPKIGVMEN